MSHAKTFVVRPGYVTSRSDGDRHWIGAQQLMELNGVDPRDCVIEDPKIPLHPGYDVESMVVLEPKEDGEYGEVRWELESGGVVDL
jgi:hypothetical protein